MTEGHINEDASQHWVGKVRHTDAPPENPNAKFASDVLGEVTTIKSVIELRPSWWRHPIRRWKLRHLLPDMEAAERERRGLVSDELADQFDRRMEDAFLNGDPGPLGGTGQP